MPANKRNVTLDPHIDTVGGDVIIQFPTSGACVRITAAGKVVKEFTDIDPTCEEVLAATRELRRGGDVARAATLTQWRAAA